jgi:hypothetical protein
MRQFAIVTGVLALVFVGGVKLAFAQFDPGAIFRETPRASTQPLSQSELDAMRTRLAALWNVQPGVEHPEELYVTIRVRLNRERRLAAPPQIVSTGSSPRYQAAAEAAVKAVIQGQPYTMLRDETYEQWKYMDIDFDPRNVFRNQQQTVEDRLTPNEKAKEIAPIPQLFHSTKKDIRGFYLGMTTEQVKAKILELTGGRKCETDVYPCIGLLDFLFFAKNDGFIRFEFTRHLGRVWKIVLVLASQKSRAELSAALLEQFGITPLGGDKDFRTAWEIDDGSLLSLNEENRIHFLTLWNPTFEKLDEDARQKAIRDSPNPKF